MEYPTRPFQGEVLVLFGHLAVFAIIFIFGTDNDHQYQSRVIYYERQRHQT